MPVNPARLYPPREYGEWSDVIDVMAPTVPQSRKKCHTRCHTCPPCRVPRAMRHAVNTTHPPGRLHRCCSAAMPYVKREVGCIRTDADFGMAARRDSLWTNRDHRRIPRGADRNGDMIEWRERRTPSGLDHHRHCRGRENFDRVHGQFGGSGCTVRPDSQIHMAVHRYDEIAANYADSPAPSPTLLPALPRS